MEINRVRYPEITAVAKARTTFLQSRTRLQLIVLGTGDGQGHEIDRGDPEETTPSRVQGRTRRLS